MKRNLLVFLTSILLISISSCSNQNHDYIYLKQKENIDTFYYINKEYLSSLITTNQDFMLVIGENGCSTCDEIKPEILSFIRENEVIVYWIEYNQYDYFINHSFNEQDLAMYSLSKNYQVATIELFNNGKLEKVFPYSKSLYYSKDKLKLSLNRYIKKSNLYSLNDIKNKEYSVDNGEVFYMKELDLKSENELQEMINKNEKINILFTWNKCPDCKDFINNFLTSYLSNSKGKLYFYEVDYLRNIVDDNNNQDLSKFHEFASKYAFSSYRNGRVPTIVTYENGQKKDMVVYLNDIASKNENDSYSITTSYYKNLIGITGSSEIEVKDKAKEEEKIIIKKYLDENL